MTEREDLIRQRLNEKLKPSRLEIVNESHLHAGHPGARDGRGHFAVSIESEQFCGLSPIARHRLIYQALGTMMTTDIHALRIEALSPGETL